MSDKENNGAEEAPKNRMIKVKARRPVDIPEEKKDEGSVPVVLVKAGATAEVTEKQFARHSHLLERIVVLAALLCVLAFPAIAQDYKVVDGSYSVTNWTPFVGNMSSNNFVNPPFNDAPALVGFGPFSNTWSSFTSTNGSTNGTYVALTNHFSANSTNMVMCAPLGLTKYDEFVLNVGETPMTNNGAAARNDYTNYLFFGFSSDGVTFTPTNQPAWTVTVIPSITNLTGNWQYVFAVSNLSRFSLPPFGSVGFLQLQGVAIQGTNDATNFNGSVWIKPKRNG